MPRVLGGSRTSVVRVTALAALLALASVTAACQSTTPTPSPPGPTGSAAPTGWTAARVEQPGAIEATQSAAPTFCSPCHPSIGTYISTLVPFHGGYLALGYELPPSRAAAWQAGADAGTWKRVGTLTAPEGSAISAAAVGPAGIVAVGTSGGRAAIWRTTDGAGWALLPLGAPAGGGKETLTSIVRTVSGSFVAGGFVESATAEKTPSLWRSADGASWTRADVPAPATASTSGSSEVTGVATSAGTVVAVGIAGDERRGTAAVWRSADGGATWQAVASPALATGRMLAVTTASRGFVAVGEKQDQTGAAAWYSIDGRTWNPARGAGLVAGGAEAVMLGVSPDGPNVAAAGWLSDAGNGSVAVWQSTDGLTWTRVPADPSFSGAGGAGLLAERRLLVFGTKGWPDTHAAQVWIGPTR